MPSEPENKIEPLLKTYAEHRRQAAQAAGNAGAGAGAEPAMPPATRSLLRAAIRQRWPAGPAKTGEDLSWWLSLKMFWPRWVAAGGIAAVLGAAIVWMNPSATREEFAAAPNPAANPIPPAEPESLADKAMDKKLTIARFVESESSQRVPVATELAVTVASTPAPALAPSPVPITAPPLLALSPPPSPSRALKSLADSFVAGPSPVGTSEPRRGTAMPEPAGASPSRFAGPDLTQRLEAQSDARYRAKDLDRWEGPTTPTALAASTTPLSASLQSAPPRDGTTSSFTFTRSNRALFRNTQPASPQSYAESASATESAPQAPARTRRDAPPSTGTLRSYAATPTESMSRGVRPSPAVFSNFAIEQNGLDVRIVDDDGSVYSGRLTADETPNEAVSSRTAAASADAPARMRRVVQPQPAQPEAGSGGVVGQNTSAAAAPPSLAFAVSGTNATLRQPVVFSGRFLVESSNLPVALRQQGALNLYQQQQERLAGTSAAGAILTSPQSPAAAAASMPIQILRVQGTGRIGAGSSNEVRVDAVPVSVPASGPAERR